MASAQNFRFQSPSTLSPLADIFPDPIVAKRAPQTTDINYNLGQLWIFPANNAAYILTSVVSNSATWSDVTGGALLVTSLTVNPGPTSLSTVGNGAVTIGNATNTGTVTISVGTGNFALNGNGNSISIGTDAAGNSVFIGNVGAGATTTISGGNGTGIGSAAIDIGAAAAGDIEIGNTTQTGVLYLGTSTTTGTINIGGTGAGTGTISIGAGTGARTINMGTAAAVNTVNIGTSAHANVITIGTNTANSTTALNSPVVTLRGPVQILTGAGAPASGLAINVGDFYINTTAASATTRCYMATAAGTWTNFTMAG